MEDLKYLEKKYYMNLENCPECGYYFLIEFDYKYCENCKTSFAIRNFDDEPLTTYEEESYEVDDDIKFKKYGKRYNGIIKKICKGKYKNENVYEVSKTTPGQFSFNETCYVNESEIIRKYKCDHINLKSDNDYSVNENGGVKDNKGKLRYEILDYEVMDEVVGQLTFGANKYPDPYNWKLVDPEEYIGAAGRHLSKFRQGEIFDKDSGKHHLAAVIVNYMFALWHDLQRIKKEN